ncbi:hypothetical protein ACIO14_07345 [Nocardia fluminea]|uniref:hypothetical protein n=1 Tax=Nocardia fluminea TaxID=134984 RepID=UPI0037FFDADE
MPGRLLLDTNYISMWQRQRVEPPVDDELFVSSTTLQELYNMQNLDDWGYQYLPIKHSRHFEELFSAPRYIKMKRRNHKWRRRLLAGSDDRFIVSFPVDMQDYGFFDHIQQGHKVTALIHNEPHKASLAPDSYVLSKGNIRHVVDHFDFVTENQMKALVVDERIGVRAVEYLGAFLELGYKPKGNPRNTFNDLLILATAAINETGLRTEDKLLDRLYETLGLKVHDRSDGFVTVALEEPEIETASIKDDVPRYINSQWRSQSPGDAKSS